MRKVKFTLSIGIVGAKQEETFEYDDDVSEDEIDDDYSDWVSNYIDGGWNDVK